jgi:hypothetical protein
MSLVQPVARQPSLAVVALLFLPAQSRADASAEGSMASKPLDTFVVTGHPDAAKQGNPRAFARLDVVFEGLASFIPPRLATRA